MKRKITSIAFMLVLLLSFASTSFAASSGPGTGNNTWAPVQAHGNIYIEGNFINDGQISLGVNFRLYRVTPNGDVLVGSNWTNTIVAGQTARLKIPLASNQPDGQYRLVLDSPGDFTVIAYLGYN
ncbi:hypothetical protein PC41400_17355 [Paenibacillus chitinolyticus]|uniref:Uncharacterized protein n=1 Tax=Paenibacillus chitinolyticus TaxID=79263 RepID=A0A410WYD2_9BACL|nr:hypothetical protein [Paenibacillus chitinolyticus]MCY9589974.1 hypothetical protein [Paenibacillus chitinolyticus]MCY9596311.1 hypothetical protein [Paenibacillus chitinolyticus]QAV19340.1 hypothetical protein PC41400_17355 [Paenibacillus chitinolyticus]